MEAVKIGRRRVAHDLDCPEYQQMKRKMVGDVRNLESSVDWPVSGRQIDKSAVPDINLCQQQQPQHVSLSDSKPDAPLPTTAGIVGGCRLSLSESQAHTTGPQPTLPPNIRESERMQFVERWINSIPTDAPLWAQTSLNRLVSISDPRSFPDELSTSDTQPNSCDISRGYDYFSSQLHSTPCAMPQTNLRLSPHHNNNLNKYSSPDLGNLFDPSRTNIPFSTQACLLGPRHPTAPSPSPAARSPHRCSRMSPTHRRNNHPKDPCHFENGCPPSTSRLLDRDLVPQISSSNRFFDDMEMQVIVKLFEDFFSSGVCPSLGEVRHRIANSVLPAHRNATSIRAKVKRLQTSGRWTDYVLL